MQQKHRWEDEDMDQILSEIIRSESMARPEAIASPNTTAFSSVKPAMVLKKVPKHTQSKPVKQKRKLKMPVKAALLIVVSLGMAGALLYRLKDPVESLFAPPSPFTAELKQKAGFPLFFPTKLPAGFKLDKDTISQGEQDVVLYAISDESGKTINITLQSQPNGLNLDPLFTKMTELRDVPTTFGVTKVGYSSEDNRIMSNTTTGKTWIIVNMVKGTVNDESFNTLLRSLKEG